MGKEKRTYICPAELAGTLDNVFRKLVHKPWEMLKPYVSEGMTVIDLGCGPGYFTDSLARLTGDKGKVIAADLQQRMLEKMLKKIRGTDLETRIETHLCQHNRIGITQKVDFILAFWMIHEVPDQQRMFEEMRSILNPGGKIWIVEPKMHVTNKAFERMVGRVEAAGLEIIERPKVALSRSVLLKDKR